MQVGLFVRSAGNSYSFRSFKKLKTHSFLFIAFCDSFRKKPKPRQFFLFNDILVYGNILISKKRYNKQHVIPLEEVQLQDLEDEGGQLNDLFCAVVVLCIC